MSEDKANQKEKEDWGGLFQENLVVEHKAQYVKQPKQYNSQDGETCIICKIIRKEEDIFKAEIYRNDHIIVFLNKFPYTSAHSMISPLRHVTGYEDLTEEELTALGKITQKMINVIKHYGNTDSLNVGWNQGQWSGGSIKHYHQHLVPRYKTDINFIDIIGKARPILEDIAKTHENLLKFQEYLSGERDISEIQI